MFIILQMEIAVGQISCCCLTLNCISEESARTVAGPLKSVLGLVRQQELRPVVLLHEADEGLRYVPVADPRPCEHVVGAARDIFLPGEDCSKTSCSEKRKSPNSVWVEGHW